MQQARERAARRSSNAARNRERRRAAEDHRRRDEAQCAGVRRAHRRRQRREGRRREGPARRRRTRVARRPVDRARPARDRGPRRTHGVRGQRIASQPGRPGAVRRRDRRHHPRTGAHRAHRSRTARASPRCCASSPGTSNRTQVPFERAEGRIAYLSQRLDLLDPDRIGAAEPRRVCTELGRDATDASVGAIPVPRQHAFTCRSRRCPAASGCAPRSRACCTPSRPRSFFCSTSRPTTSIWSASGNWSRALQRLPRRVRRRQPRRQISRRDRRRAHAAVVISAC